jgi:hypothetical protein
MRYIKLENNQPVDYTIEQLLIDNPNAIIYKISQMPNEQLLAQYNVYPLITEPVPQLTEDETVEESTPEFRDGEWHQTWQVRKLTKDEISEIIESRTPIFSDANADGIANADGMNEGVGRFIATVELQEQRYEICKTCDSFTALKTCRECGCIMPLKIKINSASCPLEKW